MNDMLFKSKKEMVLDEIEKIHRCHIDGDDFGPFGISNWTLEETLSAYNDILQNLYKMPDLSEKDISDLETVLNERITKAPVEDKQIQKRFEDQSR